MMDVDGQVDVLKHVGLDLRRPVFSHGQLYVGLSRCTSGNCLKVLLKEVDGGRSVNVVYNEVLTGLDLKYYCISYFLTQIWFI
jgi:hypothetical protein